MRRLINKASFFLVVVALLVLLVIVTVVWGAVLSDRGDIAPRSGTESVGDVAAAEDDGTTSLNPATTVDGVTRITLTTAPTQTPKPTLTPFPTVVPIPTVAPLPQGAVLVGVGREIEVLSPAGSAQFFLEEVSREKDLLILKGTAGNTLVVLWRPAQGNLNNPHSSLEFLTSLKGKEIYVEWQTAPNFFLYVKDIKSGKLEKWE